MHILQRILRIRFVRGLVGAGAGALIAVLVYGVYEAGAGMLANLTASGTPMNGQVQVADTVASDQQIARIAARAREIAAQMNVSSSASSMSMSDAASSVSFMKPVAAVMQTSSAFSSMDIAAVAAQPLHSGAPRLPSSGPASWIAALTSLAITALCMKKVRGALVTAAVRVVH